MFKKNSYRSVILSFFSAGILLLASGTLFAAEDPVQMMKGVTNKVMQALKDNRSELRRNPAKIYEVVNRYILPHADFVEMSRWVVGRNAWQRADAATQQEFVSEFRNLVVRSYAQSLLNYSDQTIEFLPMRGSAEKDRVQISSVIHQPGKKSVSIDYRLLRANGTWKVYDIIIEHVSLMQGYNSQFKQEVQQGGLRSAINKLKTMHSKPGAKK